MIINDLVQPVVSKLRQRTELTSTLPYYIAIAIIDLTENYEFEELKVTGPLTNFIENKAEYPMIGYDPLGIQGNPFIYQEHETLTFVDSWFIYFDTDGIVTPGISQGKEIDKRDMRVVEPMSKVLGIPTVWTQHGNKKSNGRLIVGMMPDNPYPTQMRYQRQHPFGIPFGSVIQAINSVILCQKLGTSYVFMPDDWSDIIVLYAAEKVCDDVGMNDIGTQYHQKLFGYKDKRGNEVPGLINAKMMQEERNSMFNSRALRPVVRPYSSRRR